jgi:hypothetical protein
LGGISLKTPAKPVHRSEYGELQIDCRPLGVAFLDVRYATLATLESTQIGQAAKS